MVVDRRCDYSKAGPSITDYMACQMGPRLVGHCRWHATSRHEAI